MDGFERALYMLPEHIRQAAEPYRGQAVEEIRLRLGRRPSLLMAGRELELPLERSGAQELQRVLERATGASMHSVRPAMSEGYISYMGLRIGLCGTAVLQGGEMAGFKNFSSLAIRIPRQCAGICDELIREIYRNGFENTLIISKPGGGKTTALRELIRRLSDTGIRFSVVDERNELSATDESAPQFDLGRHSDVMVGVPKAQGAMMLLRGMNPQVIAMDEITRQQDLDAISQIFGCGVGLLASAHAASGDELLRRPLYKELMELRIFKYLITINCHEGKRSYTTERI